MKSLPAEILYLPEAKPVLAALSLSISHSPLKNSKTTWLSGESIISKMLSLAPETMM